MARFALTQQPRLLPAMCALAALAACGGSDDAAVDEPVTTGGQIERDEEDDIVVGDLDDLENDLASSLTIEFGDGSPSVVAQVDPRVRCGQNDETSRIITTIEQVDRSTYLLVSDQPVESLVGNGDGPSTVTVWELDAASSAPDVLGGPWSGTGEVTQGAYGPIFWWIKMDAALDTGDGGTASLQLDHVIDECGDEGSSDLTVFEPEALFGLSPSSG